MIQIVIESTHYVTSLVSYRSSDRINLAQSSFKLAIIYLVKSNSLPKSFFNLYNQIIETKENMSKKGEKGLALLMANLFSIALYEKAYFRWCLSKKCILKLDVATDLNACPSLYSCFSPEIDVGL